MLSQVLLRRPEIAIRRRDDAASGEGEEKTGGVGNEADLARGDDVVIVANAQHPFVEGPVAEFAERHAVADVVILGSAPTDDMGGIDDGVPFRSDDPHAAEGAAVVVGADNETPKPLRTSNWPVSVRSQRLFDQRQMALLLQFQTVAVGLGIDPGLLFQRQPRLVRKAGTEQRLAQRVAACGLLHGTEKVFVEAGAEGNGAQLRDRADVVDRGRDHLVSRQRHQFPERFVVQAGEGKGDAAGLSEGDDAPPVEVKEFVEFGQIAGDGDEGGGDDATRDQIEDRQQQDRLVRGLSLAGRSEDGIGCPAEMGELADVGFEVCHWISVRRLEEETSEPSHGEQPFDCPVP